MYTVKSIFYSLQGEGINWGRPAVFCRFSGCNLWNGLEKSRSKAICQFCDTDFKGTDPSGGKFSNASALVEKIQSHWVDKNIQPFIICTGGEPLLQLDQTLINCMHDAGFHVAIETNGTIPPPENLDWICISPKANTTIIMTSCNELKLVFPQRHAMPSQFEHIKADHYLLSPLVPLNKTHNLYQDNNTKLAIDYCLTHPKWRLSIQTHKIFNIE